MKAAVLFEANKPLAVLKIVGLTALLIGVGVAIYVNGKRRSKHVPAPMNAPL